MVGDDVEPDIQLLRAQSISCGIMKMLQRVEMQGFTGFEMEMEFMKIILASAPVLEEIFVWNMVHYIHRGTKMMDEMKQFSQVSADVRFIFEEAYADPEFPRLCLLLLQSSYLLLVMNLVFFNGQCK